MCKQNTLCSKIFDLLEPGRDFIQVKRRSRYTIFIQGKNAKLTIAGSGKLMRMRKNYIATGKCILEEKQGSLWTSTS